MIIAKPHSGNNFFVYFAFLARSSQDRHSRHDRPARSTGSAYDRPAPPPPQTTTNAGTPAPSKGGRQGMPTTYGIAPTREPQRLGLSHQYIRFADIKRSSTTCQVPSQSLYSLRQSDRIGSKE
jgi:hypothetical protein